MVSGSTFDLGATNVALALDVPFPANVNSGPGIEVDKSGGTWTLSLSYPLLNENTVPVPGNLYGAFYDTSLGAYEKVRMDNLIAAATGLDTRQPIVDANYNVTTHDRYVGLTMALTAPRIVAMPPANSVPGGREVVLEDEVGGLSGPNNFTIQPTGTDTINGKASYVLATPYGGVRLRSNGTNAWNVVATTSFYLIGAGVTAYTASPDANVVAFPAFSAPVAVTLPAAAAYPKGRRFTAADNAGSCTVTNTMKVQPAGADLINGVAAPAIATMNAAYSTITLVSDGVSRWTVIGGGNITAAVTVTSAQISDASALGRQLLTNAAAPADRTALGSGAVGDAVFVSTTTGAAQTALGLGTMATQAASGVSITGGTIAGVAISGGTNTNSTITTATINSPTISGGHIDNAIIGATTPAAATITSLNGGALAGERNMIINGEPRIDQRNGGAVQTPGSGGYTVDRWEYVGTQAGKFNCQQNISAITPPPGFGFYHGYALAAGAYAVTASDTFVTFQPIEGFNISGLAFGTASAKPVTLSFWALSSVTGTHSGALCNLQNATRSYPFTFSIPVASVWTYISVTIPGDTAGTWATNNTVGAMVRFNLGSGSTYSGPAGAWAAGNFVGANGAVSIVGTSGGNFLYTGVQLEAGSVATPFERRLIGTELVNCQRYYERMNIVQMQSPAGGAMSVPVPFKVTKRANATASTITPPTLANVSGATIGSADTYALYVQFTATIAGGYFNNWLVDASAEL